MLRMCCLSTYLTVIPAQVTHMHENCQSVVVASHLSFMFLVLVSVIPCISVLFLKGGWLCWGLWFLAFFKGFLTTEMP